MSHRLQPLAQLRTQPRRTVESDAQARRRRQRDPHELRILAWCVARDKYSAEPRRTEGGRRGRARIVTLTFYVEHEDYRAADIAVSEIEVRRAH